MELLNLLLDSNSLFIRHLVEQDSSRSLMSGTGSKSGRRHTVLAKFKVLRRHFPFRSPLVKTRFDLLRRAHWTI